LKNITSTMMDDDIKAHTEVASKQEILDLLHRVQNLEEEQLKQQGGTKEDQEASSPTDVITINAGGKIIEALRETLCLVEGSTFAHMFTERWQHSNARDEQGRIFLDYDPEMIESIVNFLRLKKIQGPQRKIKPPTIAKEKEGDFYCLLEYFGLEEFFTGGSFGCLPADLQVLPASSHGVTIKQDQGKYQVNYNGSGEDFLAFYPALAGQKPYFWKCTIVVSDGGFLYLGLIGTQYPADPKGSYRDSTSFGWEGGQQYSAGRSSIKDNGWMGFREGDVVYFRLQDNVLTMCSILKNLSFSIPNIPDDPYIHFDLGKPNIAVELESLSKSERLELGW